MDHNAVCTAHAARLAGLLDQAAYSRAWRYACRLAGTREDAEDLLQDALAQALLRLGQLRDDGAFLLWLLRIVRTRFLMRQRASGKRVVAELPADEPAAQAAWALAADDGAGLELACALRALPAEQRALLCLHYLDGLEASALALVLGVSRAAVEQRLHRARLALKRAWGGAVVPQPEIAPEEG